MALARAFRRKARAGALRLVAAVALAGSLAAAALQAPAAAQALSPGCGLVNDPSFDGVFSSVGLGPLSFFAGEQLTVGAAVPPPGSGTAATGFQLFINAVVVGTSNVPGTLTYTFPSSASFSTAWQALPALPAPTRASFTLSCAAPVAASFRGLSATNTKRGVLVRWRAASEVDALGFNVYRAVQGKRARVNAHLIAAHGVGAYSFLDRKAPQANALRYWIQLVNLDGSRSWYGPARVARP